VIHYHAIFRHPIADRSAYTLSLVDDQGIVLERWGTWDQLVAAGGDVTKLPHRKTRLPPKLGGPGISWGTLWGQLFREALSNEYHPMVMIDLPAWADWVLVDYGWNPSTLKRFPPTVEWVKDPTTGRPLALSQPPRVDPGLVLPDPPGDPDPSNDPPNDPPQLETRRSRAAHLET